VNKNKLLVLVVGLLFHIGCTTSQSRLVRPTHGLFAHERRAEIFDRAVTATARNNQRILVVDRETGVLTTPDSTLLLSRYGNATYVSPRILAEDEAAEEERANFLFLQSILSTEENQAGQSSSNNITARNSNPTNTGAVLGYTLIGIASAVLAPIVVYYTLRE
jgi:hypothetical protein